MAAETTLKEALDDIFNAKDDFASLRNEMKKIEILLNGLERAALKIVMEAGVFGLKPNMSNIGFFICDGEKYRCDRQQAPMFTICTKPERPMNDGPADEEQNIR